MEASDQDGRLKKTIVVVQDETSVQDYAKNVAEKLKGQGDFDIEIMSFKYGHELEDFLNKNKDNPDFDPSMFIMDYGGANHKLGAKIVDWFNENRPQANLPFISFLSLDLSLAVKAAATLKLIDSRVETGYVSYSELHTLSKYLSSFNFTSEKGFSKSSTRVLRRVLNHEFGLDLPMNVNEDLEKQYEAQYKRDSERYGFEGFMDGIGKPADVLKYERNNMEAVARSFQQNIMGLNGQDVDADATFFEGTGIPVKGRAVFTLDDVMEADPYCDEKPVLFMQNYDPNVVPLLDSGLLGGIVLCGTYLASHLSFLCDANKVSGLFGLAPEKADGLSAGFNELVKSELPPYFENQQAVVNGVKIENGQDVIIRAGGQHLIAASGAIEKLSKKVKQIGHEQRIGDGTAEDLAGLKKCMHKYLQGKGLRPFGVKVNVDSPNNRNIAFAGGIGLVRTEQVASGSERQIDLLKGILLNGGEKEDYQRFNLAMQADYRSILGRVRPYYPVKIRLFDLSPKEFLDKDEQKQFHAKYGRMDIHGGQALDTWHEIYETQITAIFRTMKSNGISKTGYPHQYGAVQIMMPAIRTEEDVLKIKNMVGKTAEQFGISPQDYSFGVMIETLDSVKNAEAILPHCDFISFGTNDLTQQVLDIPRDDLGARNKYKDKFGFDPVKKMAPEVMAHVRDVCAKARKIKPDMEIDLCGGQGADIETAMELRDAGVDNISVAPSVENIVALQIQLMYKIFDSLEPRPQIQRSYVAGSAVSV